MDYTKEIEEARKHGVDMSWLQQAQAQTPAPAVSATGGVERVSPGAQQLMEAIRQAQARSPVYMPFAAGTPTQQRRQADESSRQFEVGHEYGRDRDVIADERYRQEWDYKVRQDAIANAARASGGASDRTLTERTRTALSEAMLGVDDAIQNNPAMTLNQLIDNINKQQAELTYEGVDPQALRDFAMQKYYQHHYSQALQATQGGPRWDYGQDTRSMPWLEEQYGPSAYTKPPARQGGITRADAERYAADSGNKYTAEQIMDFEKRGMLEYILKGIYGKDYGGSGGEEEAVKRLSP